MNLTKAETLEYLLKKLKREKIKHIKIPKFIFISKRKYLKDKKKIFNKIKKTFKNNLLIIRSSSKDEDNINFTNAGKFLSFQKVRIDEKNIYKIIDKVIIKFKSLNDQILIQSFISNAELSGVIFTREANFNSPYYIINYDSSGKTNLVTSGKEDLSTKTEVIYRDKIKLSKKFYKYLISIKKIEKLFSSDRLDIEFAIKNKTFYLFQCRNIPKSKERNNDTAIDKTLVNLRKKIDKMQSINPTLPGKTTYFSNMSDWNPAEMIGNKPKPLAISLYSELITNKIWSIQRKEYGYKDVSPNILMVNLSGTPFIDLRTDLNSFIPKRLKKKITNKLINNYLKQIKKKPYLHDKIEFDIIPTCYDLNLQNKKFSFLSNNEKKIYFFELHSMTNNILSNIKNLLNKELNRVKILDYKINKLKKTNLSEIQKIFFLIDDCKKFGTLPFSGVARLAFIFTKLLNNLKEKNLITDNQISNIYSSIPTITKQINSHQFKKKNKKNKYLFLKKFGHLRPSTYSISSLNYKEGYNIYFSRNNSNNFKKRKIDINIISKAQHKNINKLLKKNKISINSHNFIRYLKKSIEYREYFKFIFSKSINEIFDNLIKLGKTIQINRNDLEYIAIDKIINSYSILETQKLSNLLKSEVKKNKKSFNITKKIYFPDFIEKSNDIYYQEIKLSKGNFITTKQVSGHVLYLKNFEKFKKLDNKIIFLDNADPGYDFIFSQPIKGLITKYGGSNSHMAIRCLELNIPAIIGIGQTEFERLKKGTQVEYDCEQKVFKTIY